MIEALNISIHNGLFLSEVGHLMMAFIFGSIIYLRTKSVKHFVLVIVLSMFVDLDHLIGYFRFYRNGFNLAQFFDPFLYYGHLQIGYFPFHAWEWVAILGIMTKIKGWKSVWAILFLALFAHILWDTLDNDLGLSFYFLTHRALNGFQLPH